MLKSFSNFPALVLVIVIDAPENKNEKASDVRSGAAVMLPLFFGGVLSRSVIKISLKFLELIYLP